MARCDAGHDASEVKSAIVDGKFGHYCIPHIKGTARKDGAQAARWHRSRDFEDHRREMIQPRLADGSVNYEFARNYPEEAEKIFTTEQVASAERKL